MKFLVFVEQREGLVRKASLEALGLATRLASGPVCAVMIGRGAETASRALSIYGVVTAYIAEREELLSYSSQGYTAALDAALRTTGADVLIMAATATGKELAPRIAARHGVGVLADVLDLRLEDDQLVGRRPVYSGKAWAEVDCSGTSLQVVTVRPNVFPAKAGDTAGELKTERLEFGKVEIGTRVMPTGDANGKELDPTEAAIVISGGRGVGKPENWPLIQELVDALGDDAAPGASRAVVDAGWADHHYQVGQTGKVVSPMLYVAIGISGAIQHLAGMSTSQVIVAINQDPEAPIFKVANYGVVADLFSFVPAFTQAVRAIRAPSKERKELP